MRKVPDGAIFGDKTPVIVPQVSWLSTDALLALLNSEVADFLVKTFLGSLMQIEIGDIRRLPIPVLTQEQGNHLEAFAQQGLAAASNGELYDQTEMDLYCRELYGLDENDELWVTR